MKVSSARDLMRYWRDYPPVHVLVRGAVGFKGAGGDDAEEMTLEDVQRMINRPPPHLRPDGEG